MRTAKATLPLARGGIHLARCSRHRLELVAHLVEQSPEPLPFLIERLVRTGFPRLAALIGARIATSYRLAGSLLEDLDDVCSMPLLGCQRGSVAFWRRGVLAGVPPRAIRRLPPVSSTRFVGQPSPTVSCNAAPSISPEGGPLGSSFSRRCRNVSGGVSHSRGSGSGVTAVGLAAAVVKEVPDRDIELVGGFDVAEMTGVRQDDQPRAGDS